jgi:hypothetical protein
MTNLAFLDFKGCFALKYLCCDCGFCAYCLQNCGNDARAHQHVANCPHNMHQEKMSLATSTYLTVHRRSGKQSGSKRYLLFVVKRPFIGMPNPGFGTLL